MAGVLDDLWCDDCGKAHEGLCKKGTLHKVQDAIIPSRARLTLPPSLSLKTVKESGKVSVGVFTKKPIPVRSQFGPMDAPVMTKLHSELKPKVTQTVWKKKHAMQKAMETSGLSASSEVSDLNTSTSENQSSPIIAHISGSAVHHKSSQHGGTLVDGSGLQATDMGITALHQQLIPISSQMVSQASLSDTNLHTLQSAMNQVPLQSSPIHVGTHITQLQQTLPPEFTSITYPSHQGNMHLQVTQENLNALQQFQQYGQQPDLGAAIHQSLALNGFTSSTTGPVPMQQGMSEHHVMVSAGTGVDLDGQVAEDSGVVDTSNDFSITETTSDTDLDESSEQDMSFEIKVTTDDGFTEILDTTDEDHSNWMIFVRPAKSLSEQNLIAYQEDGSIFYVSLKPIPSNTELKVWYSAEYAQDIGKGMLPADDRSRTTDDKLNCSVCETSFSSICEIENHPCSSKLKGRRKGRPRKYVKPTKTWRAKLEKSRLKESQKPRSAEGAGEAPLVPRRPRGRPRIKPLVIKKEKVERKSQPVPEELSPSPSKPPSPINAEIHFIIDHSDDNLPDDNEMDDDSLFDDKKLVIKEKDKPKKRGPKTVRTPLSCPHCSESFLAEATYYIHVYNHTGVKPFVCNVSDCGRGFLSKFKLERHMLIHTCPRNHKCPYCDKSFNRKDHLKNHMITHDPNKKVWTCEICKKEYSYSFSYRTHMAFHAANRGETLGCGICKKEFESKDELLFHLKVHTGARTAKNSTEKTHQCFECSKKFFTRKDVKRHMITHTKRKDYLCQFCPQRFGRKDHLTRHLRTSHTGDNQGNRSRVRRLTGESTSSPTKRRERTILIDKLEPTMVPLQMGMTTTLQDDLQDQLIAGVVGSTQPSNIVGTQAALLQNLQYAVSQIPGPHGTAREIQIPAALYEVAAAASAQQQQQEQEQPQQQQQHQQQQHQQSVVASLSNIQPLPGMPTLHTSMPSQYQVNEKGFVMNTQQPDQALFRQIQVAAPANIDYRNLTQAIQGNMYITTAPVQQQQHQHQQQTQQLHQPQTPQPTTPLLQTPKLETHTIELNRATGITQLQQQHQQQEEYQLTARIVTEGTSSSPIQSVSTEQANRTSLVMAANSADPSRQTLNPQTYSSLLRILESLPGNNATAIPIQQCLNVDIAQSQAPQLITAGAYNATVNANNILNINQADLAKGVVTISHPHGAAALQLTQQDVKAVVSLTQNINPGHSLVYQQSQTQPQS